ncbi:MAG TPA: DUF1902 domain-containing protein [Nodularia sp. (in: cyanobacteria)]|nr:DUF1902 domain-containing protein [Nodularia sp. (in: cyanobacteria)]
MKKLIRLNIEKFSEEGQDYFVATSDDIQGLVAEGKTLQEALEIAEDVAKVLLDMEKGKNASLNLQDLPSKF